MKDAYYFSHDSNARNDRKTSALILSWGMAGYGMWWVVVEMLREEDGYKLPMDELTYSALAKDMMATPEQAQQFIEDCIQRFQLLQSDGDYFWSDSMLRRMEHLEEKKEKRRKAAEKRWNASDEGEDANAMQMHSKSTAHAEQVQCTEMQSKVKESKVKKSKESKEEYAPGVYLSKQEYEELVQQYGHSTIADYIERVSDYQLSKGTKYKNHKATIRNWLKRAGIEPKKEKYHVHQNRFIPEGSS